MAAIAYHQHQHQHRDYHHHQQPSQTSTSTLNSQSSMVSASNSHPFRPSVLTVCTANLNTHRRHTQQDEDEDEDEELLDGDSSGPDEHDEDEEYLEREEHDHHHEGDVEDAEDDDEEMVLDAVIESGIDMGSHPLRMLPAGEHEFTEHDHRQTQSDSDHRRFVTRRASGHLSHAPYNPNAPAAGTTPAVPAPIVVSYGPFHHPDVDVAIPYAQMVCYLWFWTSSDTFKPQQSALQFQPQPHFIHFVRRVITQTQLSKTVLVLALHYLWLLKRPVMPGAAGSQEASMGPINAPSQLATEKVSPGSQYTVSVIALMLANKFMDDNTYTNKSWAAICGVTLEQINAMEREFLIAIKHALHVDVNRFMSWIRIMQSFFDQRQFRYDSRTRPRKVIPLPSHAYHRNHTMNAPHGHHPPQYYQPHYATSLPGATNAPSFATPPRSPGYPRARSASPEATTFQFTFVPPNRASPHSSTTPNTLAPEMADRSIETRRRPVTQHSNYHPHPSDVQRPLSTSTSEPYQPTSIDRAATGNSSHAHPPGQWPVQPNQNHTLSQPEVIRVMGEEYDRISKSRSKRSASQAFSPRSAEPPRPRPDDRERERMLVYPQPVYLPMHQQHSLLSRSHTSANGNANGNYIQTVLPPRRGRPHIVHHYSSQQTSVHGHGHHGSVRRIHHVHEALAASRPNTADELGLARLSLSGGPSPAMPTQSHQQSRSPYYQLAAPYDPYTAPTFRNEGAKDGEPLELQFYQLVQGNRGIIRCQPNMSAHPVMEISHDAYAGHTRMDSSGGSSSAPGSAVQEVYTKYPSSLSTDDEEISSSESSNGTGWAPSSHHHNHQLSQNGNSYVYAQSRPQQVNGNGYTLPSFSTLLAETQQRFTSPIAHQQAPADHGVKYAEFANAGPPASYAPEWGFQVPSTAYQVQYPSLQTAFHSPGVPQPSQHQHPRNTPNHPQTGTGMNRSDGLLRPDAAFLARTHSQPQPHSYSHSHVRSSPSAASNGYDARYF